MKYETKYWLADQPDPPITMGQVAWLTNPDNPKAVRALAAINQIAATINDLKDPIKVKEMIDDAIRHIDAP